ncbi:MAG: hypothetical protein AB9866_20460 [Syntrophobacteraceae bacterium]
MNKTVKRLLILTTWLCIACISPAAIAAPDTPAIITPEKGFHFGELPETTPVSHDFVVKNIGKATLNIKDVQPS